MATKYIDAEKLRAEIDRRIVVFSSLSSDTVNPIRIDEDMQLLSFINSLQQEQPEVDLKEEMSRFIRKYFELPDYKDDFIAEIDWEKSMKECAQYFYELARHQQNREEWNGEEDTFYWYTSKEQVSKKIEAAQGWVPSENQIEALRQIIEDAPEYYKPRCTLETLYNDLKKL